MKILIFAIILFLSFVIGNFGFCQIIGIIKYLKIGKSLPTLFLWMIILGLGAFVVIKWFNDYSTALYIGYGISLVFSFGVKPDNDAQEETTDYTDLFLTDDEYDESYLSLMTEEDRNSVNDLTETISKLQESYNNAVRDMGDYTIEDAETAYKYNHIDKEQYEKLKNSIEVLTFMKETLPSTIEEMKEKRNSIISKYR